MLRIEIGTLRKTIYLEHSPYESGAEIRIQFWNDHRLSAIGRLEKPELQEIPNDKIIRADDLISENEWNNGTWAKYLSRDTDSLSLIPVEEAIKNEMVMKIGLSMPKTRIHRTSVHNVLYILFGIAFTV